MDEVFKYLNENITSEIKDYIRLYKNLDILNNLQEIRLRNNRALSLKINNKIIILNYIITTNDILEIFEKICENSVYSYKKEICEGFITIKGGHRVGITGNCVIENGQVININYISSLNFRIAREKRDCAKEIIKYIFDKENNICNIMIISPPGAGKTTILRDLIRILSDTYNKTIGVVDERGEIASLSRGVPQKDIGSLTDVMANVSKDIGMSMIVRSMAPDIIACDEIGGKKDIEAINGAICSGAKGIFTAHGKNYSEILLNDNIKELLEKHIIERIFFLDDKEKGKIKEKYFLDVSNKKYNKVS